MDRGYGNVESDGSRIVFDLKKKGPMSILYSLQFKQRIDGISGSVVSLS